MKVLVLISGIADPKWPLPSRPDLAALQAHTQRYGVLSPFDEAALELALKLRDADPAVVITAVVAGDETLARKTAGWRLDAIHRFEPGPLAAWDCRGFAASMAQALGHMGQEADVVLVGREFGDLDDGSVPPLIAHELDLVHVNLALAVESRDRVLWATRQRGATLERVQLSGRAMLSVTNDSHNRLRHPLLKNVMAARKAQFGLLPGAPGNSGITLANMELFSAPPRERSCRMLAGTAEQRAEALAQVLSEGVSVA